ncbi:hypothetical protein UC34_19835 [Pandoraea vervacti]|uniref:N-acetylmuramoyl-L-alanine amidase n=1 Tax=Pandoraea vervacti TaxID=656178 RepID=A0ABN4U7K6_9BURK|nr:N-acetylmuramoyl-L-alanine amidase [Pandoraea vervacti]APD11390.1 hypothetical protein UC34_19835 [Pandoraea vervacti]
MRNVRQTPVGDATTSQRRDFLARATGLCVALGAPPLTQASTTTSPAASASPGPRSVEFDIDTSVRSPNQECRIRTLVLHYTEVSLAESLQILTNVARSVSAHYLVPDTPRSDGHFHVYQLVPETQLAHHAGVSAWQGERMCKGSRSTVLMRGEYVGTFASTK